MNLNKIHAFSDTLS